MSLRYSSGPEVTPAISGPRIAVGEFMDERGTQPTHLGSIRSGVGSRMKVLELERPASEVVRAAFEDALRGKGLLSDRKPGVSVLSGSIEKLDCNQYSNREAHVRLIVRLERDGQTLAEDAFASDLTEGGGLGGPFGSVEGLRLLAERALREVVDESLGLIR